MDPLGSRQGAHSGPQAPTRGPRAPGMAPGTHAGVPKGGVNETENDQIRKQYTMLISGRCLDRCWITKVIKMGAFWEPKVIAAQLWTNFGLEKGDNEFDW